jgi:hypothetical protein
MKKLNEPLNWIMAYGAGLAAGASIERWRNWVFLLGLVLACVPGFTQIVALLWDRRKASIERYRKLN